MITEPEVLAEASSIVIVLIDTTGFMAYEMLMPMLAEHERLGAAFDRLVRAARTFDRRAPAAKAVSDGIRAEDSDSRPLTAEQEMCRQQLETWLGTSGVRLHRRPSPLKLAETDIELAELTQFIGRADGLASPNDVELWTGTGGPRKQLYVLSHETLHHWLASRPPSEPLVGPRDSLERIYITERETNILCALSAMRWHMDLPSNSLADVVATIVTRGVLEAADKALPPDDKYSHTDFARWAAEVCDWYDLNKERLLDRVHVFCSEIETVVPTLVTTEGEIAAAQNAVKRNPRDVQALIRLGVALLHDTRPDEATGYLRHAVAIEPSSGAQKLLAFALTRAGQFEEAVRMSESVLEVFGEDQRLRKELADSLFQLDRFADAATSYQIVLERQPHLPWERMRLGLCQLMMGDLEAGWRSMRDARNEAPEDETIAELFRRAETAWPDSRH